jgi:histidine ammonia-lyase
MIRLSSRHDLTLEIYRRVAWNGEAVAITEEAEAVMGDAHRCFRELIASDPEISVYMVTTGGGEFASQRVPAEDRNRLPRRFGKHGLKLALGEPLPERVARGIVLARLANFLGGHAAARPEVAAAIAAMLDGRPLPAVPRHGQGGSGEIIPLGFLFADIVDVVEDVKEGNALSNGSPGAAALVADAALATRERLALAADVMALSIEAINAPLDNYSPALDDLWGDPAEAEALRSLRLRLAGAGGARRPYQTPVSWRIIPRVLGQAFRALGQAEEVATISLQSVTDNPVYVPPDAEHPLGQTFSTGGYHNGAAPSALDNLGAALADLCLLAERHGAALCDARVSLLPDKLATEGFSLFYLSFIQLGLGEEVRRAAARTFLPPSSGGFAQSDVAAPSFLAWNQLDAVTPAFDASMAILAAIGSQALAVTDRPPPPPLAEFVEEVRGIFPPVREPRALGAEVDALAQRFRERIYRKTEVWS